MAQKVTQTADLSQPSAQAGRIKERQRTNGAKRYTATWRITGPDGKRVSKSSTFGSRKAAEAWLAQMDKKAHRPDFVEKLISRKKPEQTWANVIKIFVDTTERNYGDQWYSYLDVISRLEFGQKDPEVTTAGDVVELAKNLRDGIQAPPNDPNAKNGPDLFELKPRSAATVSGYISTLGTVVTYGGSFAKMELPIAEFQQAKKDLKHAKIIKNSEKRYRRPTREELEALLYYFMTQWLADKRRVPMHMVIAAAIFATWRRGELVQVAWQAFLANITRITLHNLNNPNGTEGNDVEVLVSERAAQIFLAMPQKSERVIPYNGDTITRHFTEACKVLGIEDLRFHDLRHEGISHLIEMGYTIPQVRAHSGHSDSQSVDRYSQIKQIGDIYGDWKWWSILTKPLVEQRLDDLRTLGEPPAIYTDKFMP